MANNKSKGGRRKKAAGLPNGAAEHTEGLIAGGDAATGGGLPAGVPDGLLSGLSKGQRRSLQAQWNRFVRAQADMSVALQQLGILAFGGQAASGTTTHATAGAGPQAAQPQAASG